MAAAVSEDALYLLLAELEKGLEEARRPSAIVLFLPVPVAIASCMSRHIPFHSG